MAALPDLDRALAAPAKPAWRGGSWRLPKPATHQHIVAPFESICERAGIAAKFCLRDLIDIR